MTFIINPYVFGAGGGGFGPGPDTITDLELWLQADSLSGSDGDEITTWNDDSGNSRDFTGISVGVKPRFYNTDGPDSMPTVLMYNLTDGPHSGDNQGGYFSRAGFLSASAGHLFVVKKRVSDTNTGHGCPVGGFLSTTEDGYFPFADGIIYEPWGTDTRKTTADPSTPLNQWNLYEIRTASGAWSNWFNGTSLHSTGTNTVSFGGATYIVGGGYDSGGNVRRFPGWISEVAIYSRVLNASELTTIKDYFTAKYALTLA